MNTTRNIDTSRDLDNFRGLWGGEATLRLLQDHGGRVLINWPVGIGKSFNCDSVIETVIRSNAYDLVCSLSPTWQIINERRWVADPPEGIRVVVLHPRPRERCGDLNRDWVHYETHGLGLLGRAQLCGACIFQPTCEWPGQYGNRLRGTRVIFATQAHLMRDPYFISRLVRKVGAARTLVILDEDRFVLSGYERKIKNEDLTQFLAILQDLDGPQGRTVGQWINAIRALTLAKTRDLRDPSWAVPPLSHHLAYIIQARGFERYERDFNFIGHEVEQFGRSPFESRSRLSDGSVKFAAHPLLNHDCLIYSGTASAEFAQHRLKIQVQSPFNDYRFSHPETRWYNIASTLGAACNFRKNRKQVLDLFARLVQLRIGEGKRPLLISKKKFCPLCAVELNNRFKQWHVPCCVKIFSGEEFDPDDLQVIPIINYGVIGINAFEHFDAAYCLNSYNINESVLDTVLRDTLGADLQVPVEIVTGSTPPRRRTARAVNPGDRQYDVHRLAPLALQHLETDVVTQAVGRVRPFTRPREVVTFQCAGHPYFTYDEEFTALASARSYFGIQTEQEIHNIIRDARVHACREAGLTQSETARYLNLGRRTVQRCWQNGDQASEHLNKCYMANWHQGLDFLHGEAATPVEGGEA